MSTQNREFCPTIRAVGPKHHVEASGKKIGASQSSLQRQHPTLLVCLSYKIQHNEATVAVLTVLAGFGGHGGFSHDGDPP